MIVRMGRPLATPPKTNFLPSASQAPADLMNWMLSKWGSTAVEMIFRRILPVSASATYMSIEKRSRVDRKTRDLPSGLMDGATL